MEIRPPNREEYPDVVRVINSEKDIWQESFSEEEMAALGIGQETVESLTERQSQRNYLVAVSDEKIVGFLSWYAKTPAIAWVSMLVVDSGGLRQGIGSQLMDYIEKLAQEQGFRYVALETQKKADWAINFYKSRGYRILSNEEATSDTLSSILSRPIEEAQPFVIFVKNFQ